MTAKQAKKQYGSYAVVAFDRGTEKSKKLELLKRVVSKLIDNLGKPDGEPDLETIQLIVKEGYIHEYDPTWYAHEEPNYTPSMPFWGMTVGIKCDEKDGEQE